MLIQEPAHTVYLSDKVPLPVAVYRIPIGLGQANRTSLQWSVLAAALGASATIALYVATTDREADLLDLNPATNGYWAPLETLAGTPITFPHQPGAVIGSCLLPIGPVALSTLLVELTVAGAPYPTGAFVLAARNVG